MTSARGTDIIPARSTSSLSSIIVVYTVVYRILLVVYITVLGTIGVAIIIIPGPTAILQSSGQWCSCRTGTKEHYTITQSFRPCKQM